LASLIAHVAVPLCASDAEIAAAVNAREPKMLAQPKIARLLASRKADTKT
jgi:hypothetical protein